jgi:hypothetical protein
VKTTRVDSQGNVRCPVCGAINSFTVKRTGKGKLVLGVAAPKRLKCNGCGTNLKRGGANSPPPKPKSQPVMPWVSQSQGFLPAPPEWDLMVENMASKYGLRKRFAAGYQSLLLPDGREIVRHVLGSAKIDVRFPDPRAVAHLVPGSYPDMKGEYLRVPISEASRWERVVDRAVREKMAR